MAPHSFSGPLLFPYLHRQFLTKVRILRKRKSAKTQSLSWRRHNSGTPSSNVAVEEGVTVDIKVGTKEYESYEVPQSTVKEALNHVNIKLGKYDTVNKSLNTKVKDNTKIKVNRVSYKKTTKTEKVKFKTVKKKTNSLYVGQSKVYKKGKNGTKKSYLHLQGR